MSAARAARRRKPAGPQVRLAEFVPPEGVPIRLEVSGLGARFGAQILDIILTFLALLAFMFALISADIVDGPAVVSIGALLFFALRVPYYVAAEILWNGQTLGKRILGIRVVSGDGRSLTAHAVTLRNLMKEMEIFVPGTMLLAGPALDGWSVFGLLVWIAILLAVPLTNRHRQRLGDILANTVVVNQPRPVLLPELAGSAGAQGYAFLPHHLDHYGRYELQTLESLLRVNSAALKGAARGRHHSNLRKVCDAIVNRISYEQRIPDGRVEAFLNDFYTTQRAYLENRRLFGDAREDKFHNMAEPAAGTTR